MPFVKGSVGEEICAGDRSKGVSCRLGGENGGRPAPSGKGEKNHGKLSLQNESITRKANGGAWMIRERHSVAAASSSLSSSACRALRRDSNC